jgi:tRNA1(Val) A37 N6-methylase TrmN6
MYLNSKNANYSFDGLHIIFNQLFQKIDINKFEFRNILILGMGAGSIISLLRDKYNISCPITAIEKDEVVIELAKKYFNIDKYKSLTIKKN